MKLITFTTAAAAGERVGALVGGAVLDLTAASGGAPDLASMIALATGGERASRDAADLVRRADEGDATVSAHLHGLAAVRFLAPIPRPRKNVYCVGLNYRSHVEQNAVALGLPIELPKVPLFFSKPVTAVIGPERGIICDERLTAKLDYEVELAAVIGTGGTWISPADVPGRLLGYTIVNDVSARDLQFRTSQFLYGKGLDSYCPMGPAIVTPDELGDLGGVMLELFVNGEQRQHEPAGNMIFPPAVAIAELSKGITLEPGDVISLGTPGGCGYQMTPPRFLHPGDVVECRATGIGSLVNPVVAAPGQA